MIKDVILCMQEIEKSAKGAADTSKIKKDIQSAKTKLAGAGGGHALPLKRLSDELSVWQDKLDMILKESAGRQGMAKHARHWVEELRKIDV